MSPVGTDEIDKASLEDELNTIKEQMVSFKSMGVNVEAAEAILTQAEKALLEDNLQLAKALLDSANQTSKLIRQQYFIQASSILFSSLQRTIMELEGAGSEVNYIKDLYNKAKEMFDTGQYEEAMGYIKSAEELASNLKVEKPSVAGEGISEVEEDQSQEQMERVSKILIRVDDLLQKAIEGGYSVNEAEKLYSLAEDAFDYQDYKKAEEYALDAENTLKVTLEPMYAKEGKPSTAELAEDEVLLEGEDKSYKKPKFSDIMPLGLIGDAPGKGEAKYKESVRPDKSSEERRVFKEALPAKEETSGIKVSRDLMKEIMRKRKYTKDETILEEPLKGSEKEIKSIDETPKKTTKPMETIDLEGITNPEEKAMLLIERLNKKIELAKNAGLNTPMAERLYSIAESYFENGEFESVYEYALKGIKNINDTAERKGVSVEIEIKSKDKAGIKDLDKELDKRAVVSLEEDFEPQLEPISKASFRSLEYKLKTGLDESTDEFVKESKGKKKSKKRKKEKIKGKKSKTFLKLKSALKKIRDEIKEAKDMGLDVDSAEELINTARDELDSNNLLNAKEIGLKAKQEIKNIKKDFIRQKALDLIKVAWKEISDAEAQGLEVDEANELLEDARNQIKEGKYEVAAERAMKAINMFK